MLFRVRFPKLTLNRATFILIYNVYIMHFCCFSGHLTQTNNQNVNNNFASPSNAHLLTSPSNDDLRYHGTELVMLYDYKVSS